MKFFKFGVTLVLFCLLFTNCLVGQNYWSKRFVTDYSTGNKLVVVDDGMIVLIDQDCFLTGCAALMKVDYSGNLLWIAPIDSVQTGHVESIALENNSILVNVEYTFIGPVMPFTSYSVFKYNTDGIYQGKFDYFFTIAGGTGPNIDDWPYEIVTTADRRYVCNAYAYDSGYRARIRAYDENWNQLWQKNLNGGGEIINLNMELTIDSGLVITYSYRGNDDFLSYNSIERYDKDGNLLWLTPFEENYGPYSTQIDIAVHPDGSFFGIRKVDLESNDPDETDSPDIIYKLDMDGNFLWQKFDVEQRDSRHLFATSNGDIVLCGTALSSENTPPTTKAYVSRINSDGAIMWERYFSDSTDTYLNTSVQFGQELSNGDMAFSGHSSGLNFSQEAWLLKTDGNGCIHPGCSDDIQVYTSTSGLDSDDIQAFNVYPNPFSTKLVLGTTLGKYLPEGSYGGAIFNAQGVFIENFAITTPDSILHFDLTSYPTGLYLFVIYRNGKPVQIIKAIKH